MADTPCTDGTPMTTPTTRRGENLRRPPPERRCGVRSRRNGGAPCRNWGMRPSGRCRMHGGTSPFGIGSPTHRHGFYSRDLPTRIAAAIGARRTIEATGKWP